MIYEQDLPRWRAKLDQVESAVAQDAEVVQSWAKLDGLRPERDAELREILGELERSRDLKQSWEAVDLWSHAIDPSKPVTVRNARRRREAWKLSHPLWKTSASWLWVVVAGLLRRAARQSPHIRG